MNSSFLRSVLSSFFLLLLLNVTFAQDTFSIVAADSITRELGSAGASCVDLFEGEKMDPIYAKPNFISAIIPNKGSINVQSDFLLENKLNAIARFEAGDSPSQVISYLLAHDAKNATVDRQYGAVGFSNGKVEEQAFTGSDCLDFAGHVTGYIGQFHYSIQGNILKGKHVIDAMEAGFRNTNGDLKCRLMAAMQGAKIVGADVRCEENKTSSLFAFLEVALPTDAKDAPSFSVSVKTHELSQIEPIDSLQKIFNTLHQCAPSSIVETLSSNLLFTVYPNPTIDKTFAIKNLNNSDQDFNLSISDISGKIVWQYQGKLSDKTFTVRELNQGIYQLLIIDQNNKIHPFKLHVQ